MDLDGTILGADLQIAPGDHAALERIKQAGITVIITTGRPFPGALPWARDLGLHGPIICYQGAEIRAPSGETLFDRGIPHDVAMEVIRFARERQLHIQAYRDDQLLIERDRPEAHIYAQHAQMALHLVPDLDLAMGPTTPKLVIVAEPVVLEGLLPEVRERWNGRLNAATSTPEYLEFTNHDADKAAALRFLCQRMGVPREVVAAAGDGRNDASMLAWAALGVAVEGSRAEVIEAAHGRTIAGPGHDGIQQLADMLLS